MRNLLQLIFIIFVIVGTISAPSEDRVHQIPGVPYDHQNHPWYSGYLDISGGKFHYVYFESQKDPDNDPLVLWLNGGPGCSSLIGMVYQNGPFLFKTNTTTFQKNPFSWNMKANLLYIQSPGGVGFSISQASYHNDGTVARENLQALLSFFKKFPTLKKNDFYISGESYAGIYIPYLALEILKHNKLPSSRDNKINLKGVLVGNACTDPLECYQPGPDGTSLFQYQFLYRHGYYTEDDYQNMRAVCVLGYHGDYCKQIRQYLDKAFSQTRTSILNIYQPCYPNSPSPTKFLKQSGRYSILGDDLDCNDALGITQFFNRPAIQDLLHVNNIPYSQCSDQVFKNFQSFHNASYWIYPLLMKQQLRVWVYSGDVDADVPITGTLNWLVKFRQEFGLPIMEPWRQWWVPGLHLHQDQVGGMTWQLKGLTFASVKGAGHMVPKDKQKQAYVLIDSFLNGKPLPFKSE